MHIPKQHMCFIWYYLCFDFTKVIESHNYYDGCHENTEKNL
jgi:hypothetical protein